MDDSLQEVYNGIVISLLFLILVTIYFITTLVRQHSRINALQKERIIIEINTLELERKRIAAELHDGLGPILSTIKLNINSLDTELNSDLIIITKASKYLDDVMDNIREISYNLMPVSLVRKGLCEALKEFIEKSLSPNGIQVRFFFSQLPKDLSREKEIHIYRMVQEIVNNCLKHAKAKKFSIKISTEKGNVLLQTEDDGIGFNKDEMDDKHHCLGLKNLESRCSILDCNMICNSAINKGTRYIFEIPLKSFN